MAFLMPSAPSASVPYGSLDEPEILLSSDTRSDSSLPYIEYSIFIERRNAPKQREKVRHTPDGQDLILDHLASFGKITVNGRCTRRGGPLRTALHEFLLRAYIEHRREHIRNCQPVNDDRPRKKQKTSSALFSPTNGRLQLNASMKLGSQYGCGMLLNWRILNMFASYLTIAALLLYTSR